MNSPLIIAGPLAFGAPELIVFLIGVLVCYSALRLSQRNVDSDSHRRALAVKRETSRKEIAAGLLVAVITLCVGTYFATAAGEAAFRTLIRLFSLVAFGIVIKYTFAMGRRRGFPVTKEDGRIDVTNLLRNLVASVLVMFGVGWLCGPFIVHIVRTIH